MRLIGLTLCLLASSFGARAESVEDRVAALEARVKALEAALQNQGASPIAPKNVGFDGTYGTTLSNGETITLKFDQGKVTASNGKAGTYEIAGHQVLISGDGKTETLTIDGDHLRAEKGSEKIDFLKLK